MVSHCGFDCISLMANGGVEHLLEHLLAICKLKRSAYSDPSPTFKLDYLSFYCVVKILYVFQMSLIKHII